MHLEIPATLDPVLVGLVVAKMREAIESGHMVDIRIFVGRVSRQTGYKIPPRVEVLDYGERR